jgi:hypothetical protein
MLATKPVAIFGTSRASAADSASVLSAVVAARMRSRFLEVRFLGVIEASGMTHQRVAGHDGECIHRGSPDLEIVLAEPESGSPIPKYRSNYINIKIKLRLPSVGDIRSV